MVPFFIGLAAGLVIGWNFLPQPEWVKTLISKIRNK